MIYFLSVFIFLTNVLFSETCPFLYGKNISAPLSVYEQKLVDHTERSFHQAMKLESKLTGHFFNEVSASRQWRKRAIPYAYLLSDLPKIKGYNLLNNLCDLPGASHLHIGLLAGDSWIGALYNNQSILSHVIGIDWFKECPKNIFYENCRQYLDMNQCTIIDSACFQVAKKTFPAPIDIYFYDADHTTLGQEMAFTYYDEVFAEVFVAVVDDWSVPSIREGVFRAFDRLGYSILYQNMIPPVTGYGYGLYVAVIRKANQGS